MLSYTQQFSTWAYTSLYLHLLDYFVVIYTWAGTSLYIHLLDYFVVIYTIYIYIDIRLQHHHRRQRRRRRCCGEKVLQHLVPGDLLQVGRDVIVTSIEKAALQFELHFSDSY